MGKGYYRNKRERRTIESMIRLYCSERHGTGSMPCKECEETLRYALKRIEHCPLKERKTTCARCPVHCYKSVMRERIREVMRYAGPRMAYRHPLLTLLHLLDGLRPKGNTDLMDQDPFISG